MTAQLAGLAADALSARGLHHGQMMRADRPELAVLAVTAGAVSAGPTDRSARRSTRLIGLR